MSAQKRKNLAARKTYFIYYTKNTAFQSNEFIVGKPKLGITNEIAPRFTKTLYYYFPLWYTFFMKKIVLASSNKGKIKEISEILGSDYQVLSMAEAGFDKEIEETGKTFEENSFIKARTACDALSLPVLADDSGLEVDFLGGAPGVYSARYSGEPVDNARNRALLLKNMQNANDRKARFVCVMTLCLPNGKTFSTRGSVEGRILKEETGNNGFGYDSLFYSDDLNKSFGEASDEEKNGVSHRGRALKEMIKILKTL